MTLPFHGEDARCRWMAGTMPRGGEQPGEDEDERRRDLTGGQRAEAPTGPGGDDEFVRYLQG